MPSTPDASPLQQRLTDAIDADSPDVQAAVAAGADVNAPMPNGATPLMWAIAKRKPAAVRALLAAGADVSASDSDGDRPIDVAARFAPLGDVDVLEMVLRAGGDPNAHTSGQDPVLAYLTRRHHLLGIAVMAEYGADVDARTRAGTPLILEAAVVQYWDVVHTLLHCGADPLVVDGNLSLVKLLGDHRATPPDSPLWPAKLAVWQNLAGRGVPVPPLPPGGGGDAS